MSRQRRRQKLRHDPRNKNTRIVPGDGDACPRCNQVTQIHEHVVLTQKHLNQEVYFSRWFKCVNGSCRTTLIMPRRFIVRRDEQEIWA